MKQAHVWKSGLLIFIGNCTGKQGYIKSMISFEISKSASDLFWSEDATVHMLIFMIKALQKENIKMSTWFSPSWLSNKKPYHHGFWSHFHSKNCQSPVVQAVLALLIVDMNYHFIFRLQVKRHEGTIKTFLGKCLFFLHTPWISCDLAVLGTEMLNGYSEE